MRHLVLGFYLSSWLGVSAFAATPDSADSGIDERAIDLKQPASQTSEAPEVSGVSGVSGVSEQKPADISEPQSLPPGLEQRLEADAEQSMEGEPPGIVPATNAAVPELPDGQLDAIRKMLQQNEFSESRTLLESMITNIEEESRYTPELVEPLHLLGTALQGEGNYPAAVDAFERAAHILRTNEGLHSPKQTEIVYDEAEALLAMGDEAGANDKQEYAYEILLRSYGPSDVRLLPGMYRLAGWYLRNRNIFSARSLYGDAVLLLSRTYGESTPELLPALNGIADTYLLERFPPYSPPQKTESISLQTGSTGIAPITPRATTVMNRFSKGEKALQHAVRIRLDDPNSTTQEKVDALTKLADWYLLFKKMKRARSLYTHVFDLLNAESDEPSELVASYFGKPVPLYLPLPSLPLPPAMQLQAVSKLGYVELEYDLSPEGEVRNLKTLASEPAGMMDLKVRRALRSARYRPRITREGLQPEYGLILKHQFRYYPRHRPDTTRETDNLQASQR